MNQCSYAHGASQSQLHASSSKKFIFPEWLVGWLNVFDAELPPKRYAGTEIPVAGGGEVLLNVLRCQLTY